MWQLDPDTAREEGLLVNADYDARLDILASTTAALALIERYQKEFGDWRLADMAFNSGEYRVKNLLRGRDARSHCPPRSSASSRSTQSPTITWIVCSRFRASSPIRSNSA